MFSNACMTQRRKGLSESYVVSILLPISVRIFLLFLVSVNIFRILVILQMPQTQCPLALLAKGLLPTKKGHFVISSVGGEKEENPGKLLSKIEKWGVSGGGVFIRYSESTFRILLGVCHLCQIIH